MDVDWGGAAAAGSSAIGGGIGGGEPVRPVRESMFLSADLTIGQAAPRQVRVRNLSERGLMIELAEPAEPNAPVTLELRGIGRVSGRIAWFAEGRAGVALDQVIDPARAKRRIVTRPRP